MFSMWPAPQDPLLLVSTTDQMGEFDLAIKYMMMYP